MGLRGPPKLGDESLGKGKLAGVNQRSRAGSGVLVVEGMGAGKGGGRERAASNGIRAVRVPLRAHCLLWVYLQLVSPPGRLTSHVRVVTWHTRHRHGSRAAAQFRKARLFPPAPLPALPRRMEHLRPCPLKAQFPAYGSGLMAYGSRPNRSRD